MDITKDERQLLDLIAHPHGEKSLSAINHAHRHLAPAAWSLIARRWAYFDTTQPAASNWSLRLTDLGKQARSDAAFDPADPARYMAELGLKVPTLSATVSKYLREALNNYTHGSYLSAVVMLGVASEAAFLELAMAFAASLQGEPRLKLEGLLASPNSGFLAKFGEFRKRIEPKKPELPSDLADGLVLHLDAVLDLLRINRNEAGHPTGRSIGASDAHTTLIMAARYLGRMYELMTCSSSSDHGLLEKDLTGMCWGLG